MRFTSRTALTAFFLLFVAGTPPTADAQAPAAACDLATLLTPLYKQIPLYAIHFLIRRSIMCHCNLISLFASYVFEDVIGPTTSQHS